MSHAAPPRWLEALLRHALPAADRDAVVGDMAELYGARARRSRIGATWWYAKHTLRFVWTMWTVDDEGARSLVGAARDGRGWAMAVMGRELLGATRRLLRAPVFALVSIATVAVGIGAFASIYSVVDNVLLEPPPYGHPERLQWVWRDYWFGLHRGWLGGPDIAMLREHDDVFEGVVALRSGGRNLTGADGERPVRVRTMAASAELFDLLGVHPMRGRGFAAGDDAPDAAGVAVLGWDLWQSRFGGDPAVVGSSIYLDGEATTVVGVAPRDFHFLRHASLGPPEGADLYVPLRMDLASLEPGNGMFAALVRVREGVPPGGAKAAIDAVAAELDAIFDHRGLRMWGVGLVEDLVAAVRPTLQTLLAAAVFLLLVLAANLTTLLLGRSARRDRELAVRAALGARGRSLLASAASESMVVCVVGGALGVVLAFGGVDLIRAFAPEQLPRRWTIGVDPSVLAVVVLATFAMAAVASLLPASRALRGRTADRLRDGRRGGSGLAATRTRSGLVVVQLALSLTLLVGAGLLTRAFVNLLGADPGFDGRAVLTTTVSLDPMRYPNDADAVAFDRRLRTAVAALPGVGGVGAADALPLSAQASQTGASFPGAPGNTGEREEDHPLVDYMMITPGYVEAIGMRVLDGRTFEERDDVEASGVALVDDLLARRFFPTSSALGRTLVLGGDTLTIVGVVDQARHYTVAADDRPQVYVPLAWNPVGELHYAVAGTGDPLAYAQSVRDVLDGLDPAVPMSATTTLGSIVADSLARERLSLVLLASFAAGALLLATLGLYGVVSNAVAARSVEMGVRIALGADRGGVLRLVLGHGLRLAAWGMAVGLLGAALAARALARLMPDIDAGDPLVYVGVALLLVLVAGMAAWIPARRATRVDPAAALRAE